MTIDPALIPANEEERIAALREYRILDTAPESGFDELVRLAGYICGTPIAYVSLVDVDRQWFKSKIGLGVELEQTPREVAFCAHTILQETLFIVPDATADSRFADLPLVTAEPKVRFYAGAPLISPEGQAVGALCVMDNTPRELTQQQRDALRDLSHQVVGQLELRRQVTALRESQETTRAIFDNMLNGIITIDDDFIIHWINPAAAKMFGYGEDELLGRHVSLLVPEFEEDPDGARIRKAQAFALGRVSEWEGRRKDGVRFPYELTLCEYEAAGGRRVVGNLRDLSALREVERMKKEFVATVSHELRTPLTSIRGSLGLLSAGAMGGLPDDAHEVVAIAEKNCTRLIGLINDILDLERLGVGTIELKLATVQAATVLERSAETVRGMAETNGISIETQLSPAALHGDFDRLVQVVVNLMSNAVKFSPRGSAITVAAQELEGYVEFTVTDRGRGIPVSHLPLIFERFQQVEASDSRQKGGTGLGLAICRSIVELHGGAIGVESQEGEGSRFWFRIPSATTVEGCAACGDGQPTQRGSADEASGNDAHVLLIEDDPSCREVIARLLCHERIPVRTASTGREALQLAIENPPGLLILDLSLPDLDGFELVEALLGEPRLRETPLLVYTGTDLSDEQRGRLNLGPTRFLTKSRATDDAFRGEVVRMLRNEVLAEVCV